MWIVAGLGAVLISVMLVGIGLFGWPRATLELSAVVAGLALAVTPLIERAAAAGTATTDDG